MHVEFYEDLNGNYWLHDPSTGKRGKVKQKGNFYVADGIGVIPLALPALASIAPKLQEFVSKIKGVLTKLGLGGVDDERFFNNYFEMRDIFTNGKYLELGSEFHENALTRNEIRKTQVQDKGENFVAEYQRLRKWVIDVMNHANPGLGSDFGEIFPEFKLVNNGQIYGYGPDTYYGVDNDAIAGIYVDAIRAIVSAIPPNNYIPGTLQEVVQLASAPTGNTPTNNQLIQQVVDGYTYVKDAQGKILEIRDEAGRILNPNTPGYNEVYAKGTQTQQAGFGWLAGGAALLLFASMSGGSRKKAKR